MNGAGGAAHEPTFLGWLMAGGAALLALFLTAIAKSLRWLRGVAREEAENVMRDHNKDEGAHLNSGTVKEITDRLETLTSNQAEMSGKVNATHDSVQMLVAELIKR